MVLLDACCLVELCRIKPSLKEAAIKQIEAGAVVLSVSFAEIALKISKGQLVLEPGIRQIYEQYRSMPRVEIVDIGVEEWFDAINLQWKHRDPADRLMVAYASKKQLPIVTSDRKIGSFYKNVIW